jgi:hypothetical protein
LRAVLILLIGGALGLLALFGLIYLVFAILVMQAAPDAY